MQTAPQHYSKKLTGEIVDLKKHISEIEADLTAFLSYLASDKFAGFENNYINARETFTRVMEIRNKLIF